MRLGRGMLSPLARGKPAMQYKTITLELIRENPELDQWKACVPSGHAQLIVQQF
jgi:hypothetical protein